MRGRRRTSCPTSAAWRLPARRWPACMGSPTSPSPCRGWGPGAISLFGSDAAKGRMAAEGRIGRGDCRLCADRAGDGIGCRQYRHARRAGRRRLGPDRREELHQQRHHRRRADRLRPHRLARRRRARHFRLHRPRRRSRPVGRRADRGDRAPPARPPQVRRRPRRAAWRRGRRLQDCHADPQPVPGDGRRGGAGLRHGARSTRRSTSPRRASSATARWPTMR